MKAGTRYLLLKLLDGEKEKHETIIYSLNVSRVEGYQQLIRRNQKRIAELEAARSDLIGGRDTQK